MGRDCRLGRLCSRPKRHWKVPPTGRPERLPGRQTTCFRPPELQGSGSIGPRSLERGRGHRGGPPAGLHQERDTSTGPRSLERGSNTNVVNSDGTTTSLQRGRAHLSAEEHLLPSLVSQGRQGRFASGGTSDSAGNHRRRKSAQVAPCSASFCCEASSGRGFSITPPLAERCNA